LDKSVRTPSTYQERFAMKMKCLAVMAALFGILVPCKAAVEVGFSASLNISAEADFITPLEAQGTWVEVGQYGKCWRPRDVDIKWIPYTTGYWVWTDAGWFWVSDEPFAWAVYHYGRWAYDTGVGWVWVPGVEWAPSWVVWRTGGEYIGWAPLPPGVDLGGGTIATASITIAPERFIFVERTRFSEPCTPQTVVINNQTAIHETKVITNIRRDTRSIGGTSQQVVVNEGPGLQEMQKATSQKVRTVQIQEAVQKTPAPTSVKRTEASPTERPTGRDSNRATQSERESTKPGATPNTPTGRDSTRPGATTNTPTGRESERSRTNAPMNRDATRPGATTNTPTGRESTPRDRKSLENKESEQNRNRELEQKSSERDYTKPGPTNNTPTGRESERSKTNNPSINRDSTRPGATTNSPTGRESTPRNQRSLENKESERNQNKDQERKSSERDYTKPGPTTNSPTGREPERKKTNAPPQRYEQNPPEKHAPPSEDNRKRKNPDGVDTQ
jgi:hypothetical protein